MPLYQPFRRQLQRHVETVGKVLSNAYQCKTMPRNRPCCATICKVLHGNSCILTFPTVSLGKPQIMYFRRFFDSLFSGSYEINFSTETSNNFDSLIAVFLLMGLIPFSIFEI